MAMKDWFRQMQPIQLYIILALTIAFFITELILSHLTHALTLLMDSYNMLCNIIALTGCIITMKYGKDSKNPEACNLKKTPSTESTSGEELTSNMTPCHDKKSKTIVTKVTRESQERKLKNTFGWARIDVIVMLICCVFLASLSFSIVVEAFQTLIHIDHQDEMHHPIFVLALGGTGLLLNGICYLLIGGYTFHQGSFLYVTESGDVVLSKVVVNQSIQHGERRLSRTRYIHSSVTPPRQRQGLWEMIRDINGCVWVMICALIIFFSDKATAKYIDPIISLFSVTIIMILSYPYIKESCLILLQTMPDSFNIDILKTELLNHFPDIVNVHDFHVWQLTTSKIISTIHITFQNPKVYTKIIEDIKEFFNENGITHVTIQPEFNTKNASMDSLNKTNCFLSCQNHGCQKSHCCPEYEEKSLFKTSSKEVLPRSSTPDLKSVKVLDDEFPSRAHSMISNSTDSLNNEEQIKNRINSSLNEITEVEETKKDTGTVISSQNNGETVKKEKAVNDKVSDNNEIEDHCQCKEHRTTNDNKIDKTVNEIETVD